MSTPIPPWLFDGISKIQWPLDADSYQPLHMQDLKALRKIRGETCMSGPDCPCSGSSSFLEFVAHMPDSLERFLPHDNGDARHFLLVAIALVLIGNGYTDEAHCLVAPLSYPQELSFGYDPSRNSVYSSVSEEARAYASYVHSLVHRREGPNIGEFQQTGFENARYWSSIVIRSPGVDSLPGVELREAILKLAETCSRSQSVKEWIACHKLAAKDPTDETYFEARPLHELCETVLHQGGSDVALKDFCQQAVELEVRILLTRALQKSGFEVLQIRGE